MASPGSAPPARSDGRASEILSLQWPIHATFVVVHDERDENRYERFEKKYDYEWRDHRHFDRLAFAHRVLDIIQPKNMSVVLYRGVNEMRIEHRQSRPGSPLSWASVSIPPHAPPERIVYALAKLAGVADVPFVIDLLLSQATHPYR